MIKKLFHIGRFLISGASATGVIFVIMYALTDLLHVWYLASFIVAFTTGVVFSFLLQKFWTYKDTRKDVWAKQTGTYLLIQLWDLLLNAVLLYALVDGLHLWYLLAQFILSACIAVQNFILYRAFVFESPSHPV